MSVPLPPASALSKALRQILPSSSTQTIASQITNQPRNLYETLARLPRDGVGARVFQTRWQSKGIEGCSWKITRVNLKREGTRGKAWGVLTWRGRHFEGEEEIRGGLKFKWAQGESSGKKLPRFPKIETKPEGQQTDAQTDAPKAS